MSASRPRVLIVSRQPPWPLNHGGRLRLFHFVNGLSERAEVTLSLTRPWRACAELSEAVRVETPPPSLGPARDACPGSWTARRARRFFPYNEALAAWIGGVATTRRFDVTLLSGLPLGVYAERLGTPFVWDVVDDPVLATFRSGAMSTRAFPRAVRSCAFYALYLRHVAQRAGAAVFASSADAAAAGRVIGKSRTAVVQNGVDLEYFRPDHSHSLEPVVAFIGSLSFAPNIDAATWFSRRIWPALYRRDPRRRLLLVGKNPAPAVMALADIPGVELYPNVPDIRPYLRQATVVIAPTRQGGGIKNKVLEGAAMGRAVVASPTALAGLTAVPSRDVRVAATARQWRLACESLLSAPQEAGRIGACARRWVETAHRWDDNVERLFALLNQAAGGPAPAHSFADAATRAQPAEAAACR